MPARRHLIVAAAIFVAGWAVGIPVYLAGASEEDLPFELTDASKLYLRRLEYLGGKGAVVYQQLGDFLSSLFHGWRLGLTIGVLSTVVAMAYFMLAPRQ